jgi:hypothetical protein
MLGFTNVVFGKKEDKVVLDLKALRASADHDTTMQQQLVSMFVKIARRCFVRMSHTAAGGSRSEWLAILEELESASARIHANELAELCRQCRNRRDDVQSRMDVYVELREAYEGALIRLRNAGLGHARAQDSE